MAGLNFVFREVSLDAYHVADIDGVKNVIFKFLVDGGFQDVVNTPSEVACDLRDVRISIVHLPFSGATVYQIVMGGGTGDTAAEVNLVANEILPE